MKATKLTEGLSEKEKDMTKEQLALAVAQLVERLDVTQVVAGSSPVSHPV